MSDWDEHEHPRHLRGAPKGQGGEFRPAAGGAVRDLATLSRGTLLKYARERNLVIPRGLPDDNVRAMIRRFDSGVEPGWIERAGEQIATRKATKKAPAKKAPAKKAPTTELVPSSITKPGTFKVIHGGVEVGTVYVDPRGDGSAYAFPPDDGGPGLAPAPTWKRTREEAAQVLIDATKKAPAKKAAPKKAATVDPETKLWLDEERLYGPKYAAANRAMRQQGLKPEQIATRSEDLRAGMHVLVGDRFHRLVRPRTQPGKGWFTQGDNPMYLDSMPDAQLRGALSDYNRTMEVPAKKATPGAGAGVAFNSRKHPEGTRVVWSASDGETVQGTVGRAGRFTVIDWDGGKREKVRAGVNHESIRVVPAVRGAGAKKITGPDWAGRISDSITGDARPPPTLPSAPSTTLASDEQVRVRQLVRRDPQIFATVRDRYGRVSTSGNLSTEDAAWLERIYRRDRVFVEHVAQAATVDRDIRRRAKDAGQTPIEYRAAIAARLKELLDDKPIAVRVRDEIALRDILDGGRFKTSHEGARRAEGLGTETARRRLGEQIQGIPADTPYERRPVYGYVAVGGIEPALAAGRQIPGIREREGQEDVLSAYGQVQVVLKPQVRSRTTATVGDSLDEIAFLRPTPVDNPGAESVGSRLDWMGRPEFTRTGYVEAQIHGGVRVEDIAEVVFPSQPAASTVAALERRGIPWRVLPPGGATASVGDWAQRMESRMVTS